MNNLHPVMQDALNGFAPPSAAGIGHNKPPIEEVFKEINETLLSDLERECESVVKTAADLVANAATMAPDIQDDDEEKNATDIVSQMKKHAKEAESRRTGIKAGALMAGSIIDNFFKSRVFESIDQQIKRIDPGITRYKREKVEKARRAAEEAARIAREEAEAQRRIAEEAARKAREAQEAKERAEREQREAEAARARAEQERIDAERRAREAEAQRAESERRAKAAKDQEEREAAERAQREAEQRANEERENAARALREAEAERQRAAAAKTEKALASAELSDARAEVKTQESLAKQADKDVLKIEKVANASTAQLSRAHGEYGGRSGLRNKWVAEIIDIENVDKDKVWPFLKEEHVQQGLDRFVALHKDKARMRGVRFYETNDTAYG